MARYIISTVLLPFLFLQCSGDSLDLESVRLVSEKYATGNYSRAAIATNSPPCAEIAKNILLKGGGAVDGAIAAMICEGVVNPQSSGIGGGFTMTIYNRLTQIGRTINALARAPLNSSEWMYKRDPNAAIKGSKSIAIPGEVRGYWRAWSNYGGGVPWKELFEPSIRMCQEGIPVGRPLAYTILDRKQLFSYNEDFKYIFKDMKTGELLKEGDKFVNVQLAQTLQKIADHGSFAFYEGSLTDKIVAAFDGIMTKDDFKNYTARSTHTFRTIVSKKYTVHGTRLPSSGPILGYILNLVQRILPIIDHTITSSHSVTIHSIIEAVKLAFGVRSKLGDPVILDKDTNETFQKALHSIWSQHETDRTAYCNISDLRTWNDATHYGGNSKEHLDEGAGSANIVVISENGDAVVATSTFGDYFGSEMLSSATGIIFNNQMADFAHEGMIDRHAMGPSRANYVAPRRMPMTSAAPTIVVDANGDVKLAIGAASGPKIITAVAQVIIRSLLYNEDIETAVRGVAFHHQLTPMKCQVYSGRLSKDDIQRLRDIGHVIEEIKRENNLATITAIERRNNRLYAVNNYVTGQVDGY